MDELTFARGLADMADETAMSYFARNPEFSVKKDGTLVTVADRKIESDLRREIKRAYPGHAILGEEEGLTGDPTQPIWILDPIDGTANYAVGIPIFATLIGLRLRGRTEVAVVSAPALSERYEAARGDGARMNGSTIKVSDVPILSEAAVCFGSLRRLGRHGYTDRVNKIIASCKRDRGLGDFWGHMLVARGALEAMIEPALEAWDVMPLEVIVEEAGGRITTFAGSPYPEGRMTGGREDSSCLATNGAIHAELSDILNP